MDIDKLRRKRQLNVEEQNFLMRQRLLQCALAYRRREPGLAWIEAVLIQSGIDPYKGALFKSTSVPCGGDEESAYAEWVGEDGQFYLLEATVRRHTSELITIDSCRNVTSSTSISAHEPGIGKSVGRLALEVLVAIKHIDASPESCAS